MGSHPIPPVRTPAMPARPFPGRASPPRPSTGTLSVFFSASLDQRPLGQCMALPSAATSQATVPIA